MSDHETLIGELEALAIACDRAAKGFLRDTPSAETQAGYAKTCRDAIAVLHNECIPAADREEALEHEAEAVMCREGPEMMRHHKAARRLLRLDEDEVPPPAPAVSVARLAEFIGGWRAAVEVSKRHAAHPARATEWSCAQQIEFVVGHLERIIREG